MLMIAYTMTSLWIRATHHQHSTLNGVLFAAVHKSAIRRIPEMPPAAIDSRLWCPIGLSKAPNVALKSSTDRH